MSLLDHARGKCGVFIYILAYEEECRADVMALEHIEHLCRILGIGAIIKG
jgi:hypothetical protein